MFVIVFGQQSQRVTQILPEALLEIGKIVSVKYKATNLAATLKKRLTERV